MRSLGIDVGSTTAKVVVLAADGRSLHARCERHRGRPRELVERMVADALGSGPIAVRGITGSIGTALAEMLGATPIHEVRAVVRAVEERGIDCQTIVELGGQDAKIVRLSPAGSDMQMNDRCAAGTGATLDRVARRIGLEGDELAALRLEGDLSVAAKCGVFAETDVVNLVKQGASRGEAFSALARAIVVQNLAVLARGHTLRPPVLLLGGPHAHLPILRDAWVEALEQLWLQRDIASGEVVVPAQADLYAAHGAALHASSGGRPAPRARGVVGSARVDAVSAAEERELTPLRCRPLTTAVSAAALPARSAHLGIDAGSTTSKAVLIDGEGAVLAASYAPSAGNPVDDARARLRDLARQLGALPRVRSLGVTGYGASLIAPAFGADAAPVETVAHATAAVLAMPGVQVVVDVGGTDVKVMQLDGERVRDFFVSNQCSAGHGAFLAATAEELGVPLEDYAQVALAQQRAPRFTVGCAIFMDTDRVTFQREGHSAGEVLAGLATALPRNVWEFVVPHAPEQLGRRFLLTGGTQRNLAAALAQARYLRAKVEDADVRVHPHPELCGAIGAALLSSRRVGAGASRFVGFGAAEAVRVEVRRNEATRCGRCDLGCERSIVSLQQERRPARSLVVGNACERGADVGASSKRTRAHAPDLLAEEAQRLFRPLLPPPPAREAPPVVFGIPRVMGLYRSAPFLLHYLRAAGVPKEHLVLSPPTSPRLFQEGARWGVTDPCFPSKLVLAHVDHLLRAQARRPVDVLLMPTLTHARIAVRGTADTASCPIVAACGQTSIAAVRGELERLGIRPMTPELCLVDPMRLEGQLLDAFGELLGLNEQENRSALEYALRAQQTFHARCQRRGRAVLQRVGRERRTAAVVLARPYHADPGVQHGVSTELAARGLPVLGISSLPTEDRALLDLGNVLPLATNSGCAEKTWAARVVRENPNLVAVDLSSFRCGQDASILGVLSDELARAGRPVLRLHDLDEDRPGASFALRIETFLDAVRGYEREVLAAGSIMVVP